VLRNVRCFRDVEIELKRLNDSLSGLGQGIDGILTEPDRQGYVPRVVRNSLGEAGRRLFLSQMTGLRKAFLEDLAAEIKKASGHDPPSARSDRWT